MEETPSNAAAAGAPPPESAPPEGYRNLWVPLVVVPFLVVGVVVLVFVFFGAIRGQDSSIEENLQVVIHGGANERKQAAVSLAAQVVENNAALMNGEQPPWQVGPDFEDQLRLAWDQIPAGDNAHIRLALAQLLAHYGDPDALDMLASFLKISPEEDEDGSLRVAAMMSLSWLEDERVADLIVPILDAEEPFIRQTAAAVLQRVPGERSLEALRGLLEHHELELRGQAAISLSRLGSAEGAGVLVEMLDLAAYARAREDNPEKFTRERDVHAARLGAVKALARLARPDDRARFEELARDDADPAVREAAMLALEAADAPRDPGADAALGR